MTRYGRGATLPVVENKPAAEDTAILRLRDGQLRRMSPRMVDKYLAQPGAKDDVVETIQTATDETLYFFTNKGNCFMLDVSKIPETMKLRDRGSLLTGLIAGLADHEHAVAMVCVKTEEMAKKGDFLFITKNGQVKRTAAPEYGIRRARFAAINLKDEDELVAKVAEETHSSVIAKIRRSADIQTAEDLHKTVIEALPDAPVAGDYRRLAEKILAICGGKENA